MKQTPVTLIGFFLTTALSVSAQAANSLPGSAPFPDTVFLKQDCGSLQNCADNMQEMLNWVWNTRQPTAGSPLLLDIGTGDFGFFDCGQTIGTGYVTVRGSGRENTTISYVSANNCNNLAFQDLTISGSPSSTNGAGVELFSSGSTTWTNVRVSGEVFGFWEIESDPQAAHYWFSSKVESRGVTSNGQGGAFFLYSGEHWFYGGEITLTAQLTASDTGAIVQKTGSSMRVFGSAIRALSADNAILNDTLLGVNVQGGEFHMHGGQINVDASKALSASVNVHGVRAWLPATAHTPGTSYSVTAKGGGTVARARGTGVKDTFIWPASATPPNVLGTVGKDLFVETDCDDVTGNCDGGGDGTHLMISNFKKCGISNPWFDTVTRQCRSSSNP